MRDQSLEDEIRTKLIAVHERGVDLSALDRTHDPAVVTVEATLAFVVPAIAAIEEAILRLARELDDFRNA
ncbi:MAG: hypothetical protein ACYDD0_08970 [Candidatus Dormibacteria bacterium]